jgi:hypothetical protein
LRINASFQLVDVSGPPETRRFGASSVTRKLCIRELDNQISLFAQLLIVAPMCLFGNLATAALSVDLGFPAEFRAIAADT